MRQIKTISEMGKFGSVVRASAVVLLWVTAAVGTPAQTVRTAPAAPKFTTLRSFDGPDVFGPDVKLVQGHDGNFYGMAGGGKAGLFGTIFEITPGGTLTVLYDFCSLENCRDGFNPSPDRRYRR